MRRIGGLHDQPTAERFRAWLRTRGIEARVDRETDGWGIWVLDEDRLAAARAALDEFQLAPDAPEISAPLLEEERRRAATVEAQLAARRRRLQRAATFQYPLRLIPITFGVIVLCGMAAAATNFGENFEWQRRLMLSQWRSLVGVLKTPLPEIRDGEYWRLLTPCLLHFDAVHLIGNVAWFYLLGRMLEVRLGRWRYLGMLAMLGAVSNLAEGLLIGPAFGGLSGVVSGMFGYVWHRSVRHPEEGYWLPVESIVLFLGWLAICLTGTVGPIANTAHISGLMLGALLAAPRGRPTAA